jgi:hypothetical protein
MDLAIQQLSKTRKEKIHESEKANLVNSVADVPTGIL